MYDMEMRFIFGTEAQKQRDRFVLCRAWARIEPGFVGSIRGVRGAPFRCVVDGPRQLRVCQQGSAEFCQFGQTFMQIPLADAGEFLDSTVDQKAFEPEASCFPKGAQLAGVSRDQAAPKTSVYPEFAGRGGK